MLQEKILILDADLDAALVLKEHLQTLGCSQIYLGTEPGLLAELDDTCFFDLIFLDVGSVLPVAETRDLPHGPAFARARIVLMYSGPDPQVQALAVHWRTLWTLKKPFQLDQLEAVLPERMRPRWRSQP
jgi:CheY-like chemotaxis protein